MAGLAAFRPPAGPQVDIGLVQGFTPQYSVSQWIFWFKWQHLASQWALTHEDAARLFIKDLVWINFKTGGDVFQLPMLRATVVFAAPIVNLRDMVRQD